MARNLTQNVLADIFDRKKRETEKKMKKTEKEKERKTEEKIEETGLFKIITI